MIARHARAWWEPEVPGKEGDHVRESRYSEAGNRRDIFRRRYQAPNGRARGAEGRRRTAPHERAGGKAKGGDGGISCAPGADAGTANASHYAARQSRCGARTNRSPGVPVSQWADYGSRPEDKQL